MWQRNRVSFSKVLIRTATLHSIWNWPTACWRDTILVPPSPTLISPLLCLWIPSMHYNRGKLSVSVAFLNSSHTWVDAVFLWKVVSVLSLEMLLDIPCITFSFLIIKKVIRTKLCNNNCLSGQKSTNLFDMFFVMLLCSQTVELIQ